MGSRVSTGRRVAKQSAAFVFLIAAFPFALLTGFGRLKPVYTMLAQLLSLGPGMPGDYLRRGFYRLTLERCSFENRIGFGSYFAHTQAALEKRAAIGEFCTLGRVTIGERTQVASHTQVLSGLRQHTRDAEGRLTGDGTYETIHIGADVWIGAGSIVAADIGDRTTIAAGSVVFRALPADVVASGNPARVVDKQKRIQEQPAAG
jgi:acetyltransferase-like isoleucine patch superfamily enzyme